MLEIKLDGRRVKAKAFDSGRSCDLSIQGKVAIDSVADYRKASRGCLNSQLVRATGDGLQAKQGQTESTNSPAFESHLG